MFISGMALNTLQNARCTKCLNTKQHVGVLLTTHSQQRIYTACTGRIQTMLRNGSHERFMLQKTEHGARCLNITCRNRKASIDRL